MKRIVYALLCLLSAAAANAADTLEASFKQGLFEEEGNRNFKAAIAAYQAALAQFDKDRQIAATTVFRLAECHRKLGQTNEAAAHYQRILREFSDQTQLVELSRKQVPAIGNAQPATNLEGAAETEEQEIERWRAMIKESPDLVNARSSSIGTPLHVAANSGKMKLAKFLLENGARVDARQLGGGSTPLHVAAMSGNKAMVELLLLHRADGNAFEPMYGTVLDVAAAQGHKAVVEVLLDRLHTTDDMKGSALVAAAEKGHEQVVTLLLDRGANPNFYNGLKQRPLDTAIQKKNEKVVEVLLNRGARVVEEPGQTTALHTAVVLNEWKIAELLLRHKADPNAWDGRGMTPLMEAIRRRATNLVSLLLESGADANQRATADIDPPSAPPRPGRNPRQFPIELAIESKQIKIVKLLLKHKASLSVTNNDGYLPLHIGVKVGEADIIRLLLENKAEPNARSTAGETPLHLVRDNNEVAKILLSAGADPNVISAKGETPFSVAQQALSRYRANQGQESHIRLWTDRIELLQRHGADKFLHRRNVISRIASGTDSQVAFRRGETSHNRFTLWELIAVWPQSFPDLRNVTINRLPEGTFEPRELKINLESALMSGDCSENLWLEWGDIVTIPELDHQINAIWSGYAAEEIVNTLRTCLTRKVQISIKGQTRELTLAPEIRPVRAPGPPGPGRAPGNPSAWQISQPNFCLKHVINEAHVLRVSSDQSRIKVKRTDADGRIREMLFDLSKTDPQTDLWLRDGDLIEIPDKEPGRSKPE
ncbi:MAG: ankyrin repeat domain-containing protein [Verrucomicrobiota bacterium]